MKWKKIVSFLSKSEWKATQWTGGVVFCADQFHSFGTQIKKKDFFLSRSSWKEISDNLQYFIQINFLFLCSMRFSSMQRPFQFRLRQNIVWKSRKIKQDELNEKEEEEENREKKKKERKLGVRDISFAWKNGMQRAEHCVYGCCENRSFSLNIGWDLRARATNGLKRERERESVHKSEKYE